VSSSDPKRRLNDILDNIARIRRYTRGINAGRYARQPKTQDAVERCLERISEAARKLGDILDQKHPEVEFPKLRGIGSVLRHDYDEINVRLVWSFVENRLDVLERACRAEIAPSTKIRR
jgi:uncharacterized protein with HEPN domain